MDCEKFDQILIDALYDELDELTLAAAKRHTDGCQRCQTAWSGLRATRKIGVLPLVEAPAGLEERILAAAREAQRNVGWPRRVGRAVSRAGGYAMRPQTAMAASFLLITGWALLLLRHKPDRSGAPSQVSVTERGVPELMPFDEPRAKGEPPSATADGRLPAGPGWRRDEERAAASAMPPAGVVALNDLPAEGRGKAKEPFAEPPPAARARSAPAAGDSLAEPSKAAEVDKKSGAGGLGQVAAPKSAAPAPAATAGAEQQTSATAALQTVRSAEQARGGCSDALASKYEQVGNQYPSVRGDAYWAAATCYRSLGRVAEQRNLLNKLRGVAGYRDRAEAEIANLPLEQVAPPKAAPAKASKPSAVMKQ